MLFASEMGQVFDPADLDVARRRRPARRHRRRVPAAVALPQRRGARGGLSDADQAGPCAAPRRHRVGDGTHAAVADRSARPPRGHGRRTRRRDRARPGRRRRTSASRRSVCSSRPPNVRSTSGRSTRPNATPTRALDLCPVRPGRRSRAAARFAPRRPPSVVRPPAPVIDAEAALAAALIGEDPRHEGRARRLLGTLEQYDGQPRRRPRRTGHERRAVPRVG